MSPNMVFKKFFVIGCFLGPLILTPTLSPKDPYPLGVKFFQRFFSRKFRKIILREREHQTGINLSYRNTSRNQHSGQL